MIFKVNDNFYFTISKTKECTDRLLPYYLEVFKDNEKIHQEFIYGGKYYLKHFIDYRYSYLNIEWEEDEPKEYEQLSLFDFANGYE